MSGSKLSYFTTVGVKILVAIISAILIGVAMKTELLLGVANKNTLAAMPDPFTISAVAFVVCFVAGFSESLVPRFLTTFEQTRDLSGEIAATNQPPTGPDVNHEVSGQEIQTDEPKRVSGTASENAEQGAAADRPRESRYLVAQRELPREPAAELVVRRRS